MSWVAFKKDFRENHEVVLMDQGETSSASNVYHSPSFYPWNFLDKFI